MLSSGDVAIDRPLRDTTPPGIIPEKKGKHPMPKTATPPRPKTEEPDSPCTSTAIAALLSLAMQFPHRQFNSAELSILSGVGRTAMSQIKNADDTPFSLGKCTLRRLDDWLARHPGHKQE